MELGNAIFGHSRGKYPVERDAGFEEELSRLFDSYAAKRDNSWREYGEEFENDTFSVFPYYWGDCTCDHDRKESAFCESNHHAESCYQSELSRQMNKYDRESGYAAIDEAAFPSGHDLLGGFDATQKPISIGGQEIGFSMIMKPRHDAPMEAWRTAYDKRGKAEDKIYRQLCKDYKIPWNKGYGCAVHCTCEHDKNWAAWFAANPHPAFCPTQRPNFEYKPSGYQLMWYKYPLRDAYSSHKLSLLDFKEMINMCIMSLARGRQ